jgi:hypothetical protein
VWLDFIIYIVVCYIKVEQVIVDISVEYICWY